MMQWLVAVWLALAFLTTGVSGEPGQVETPPNHAQLYPHDQSQPAESHCRTAGEMCCTHAITCCIVLNELPTQGLFQTINHAECIDAGAALLPLRVPRPPPKPFTQSL